jgi:hypothetical protein
VRVTGARSITETGLVFVSFTWHTFVAFGGAVKKCVKNERDFQRFAVHDLIDVLKYDPDQYTPFPSMCLTLPLQQDASTCC